MAIFQSYKWRDLFLERHFFQKFSGHLAVFQAVSEGTLFRTSFYQVPGHLAVFGHGNEGTLFQQEKNFEKIGVLAQKHGDSEGTFF